MERAILDASSALHTPRVSQITAGEGHTVALTDAGKIFTWGKGFFGRLGTGNYADEVVPVFVSIGLKNRSHGDATVGNAASADGSPRMLSLSPRNESGGHDMEFKVVAIAAGSYHSLALTDDGTAWSWGYNTYGQLGHDADNTSIPHPVSCWDESKCSEMASMNVGSQDCRIIGDEVKQLEDSCIPSKVVDVKAGGMMSCAIDRTGVLWIWGHCPSKDSEGPSALFACHRPQPVVGLKGYTVVKVACGNEHVLSLVDKGGQDGTGQFVCFAWGNNSYGQLGLGDRESRVLPQHVQALDEQFVGKLMAISCGGFHSAALTCNEKWEAKSNFTKFDGESCPLEDQAFDLTQNAALLKRCSLCWTFGLGENGQLGHGNTLSLTLPKMVQGLPEDEKLTTVSCGLFHMGILSETGKVWTWGMKGGLGLCPDIGPYGAEPGDFLLPVRVVGNHIFNTVLGEKLACGAAHTILAVNDGTGLWAWGRGQNGILGTGQLLNSPTPCKVVWPPFWGREDESKEADSGPFQTDSPHGSHLGQVINNKVNHGDVESMEKMLFLAQKEICTLTAELTMVKHHATVLHAALYGVRESSQGAQAWDVLQDLEKKIEAASYEELAQFDGFYRNIHSRVKDALLERKMKKLCMQFMEALKGDSQQSTKHIMY